MSPERDLIERLCVEDCTLHEALHGSCYAFKDTVHASRAIQVLIARGLIELYEERPGARDIIPLYRHRVVLGEDKSWQADTSFRLRITEAGLRDELG